MEQPKEKTMRKFGLLVLVLSLLFVSSAYAADLSGKTVADDAFNIYISTNDSTAGTQFGGSPDWHTPLTFSSVGSLLSAPGTYYLHVQAYDLHQWVAGFLGDFTLTGNATFSNNTQSLLTNTTNWTVSSAWGLNDLTPTLSTLWRNGSGILQPATTGLNGCRPWGTVSGISSSAGWIWTNDGQDITPVGGNPITYRYFSTPITVTPEPVSAALFLLGGITLSTRKFFRKKK
jgi:hypothetical protein